MTGKAEITLQELKYMRACREALKLFEEIFGGKASIEDVVKRLHARGSSYYEAWEGWLLGQNPSLTIAMLKNGADVHAGEDYALCLASVWDQTEVVKILLENGADVHADNDYALQWASHAEIVKLLEQYS